MCLALIAWRVHPVYPLIVMHNRDEDYQREASGLAWRDEPIPQLSPRDLKAGGTWFAVSEAGTFYFVTNVWAKGGRRRPHRPEQSGSRPSRGLIIDRLLEREGDPSAQHAFLKEAAEKMEPFNVLWGHELGLSHFHSLDASSGVRSLAEGLHAIANEDLDSVSFKTTRGHDQLRAALGDDDLDPHALEAVMSDRTTAPDEELGLSGMGEALDRALSAIFVTTPAYGTRATMTYLRRRDGFNHCHEAVYLGANTIASYAGFSW